MIRVVFVHGQAVLGCGGTTESSPKRGAFVRIKNMLLAMACVSLSSCLGYKTPPVDTREDLLKLDPSTTWIRGRGLSDDSIFTLDRIKNAEFLDLCGGYAVKPLRLTNKGFENLVLISDELPNLNRLELCNCNPEITDKAALYIAELPHLRSLIVMGCPGFTDKALGYLASSTSIETFFLARCDAITNKGFKDFDKNTSIKGLRLENFDQDQISNVGLEYILAIPSLQDLAFVHMPFLDNDSMRLLAESKHLKKLTFYQNDMLQNNNSLEILSESNTLEELALSINNPISIEEFSNFPKFKTLRKLRLSDVPKDDISRLKDIFKAMPLCEIECTDKEGVYIYKYTPIRGGTNEAH